MSSLSKFSLLNSLLTEDESEVRPLCKLKLQHNAAVPLAAKEEAGAGGAGEDVG